LVDESICLLFYSLFLSHPLPHDQLHLCPITFFSIIQSYPKFTLFPYTTLFRSFYFIFTPRFFVFKNIQLDQIFVGLGKCFHKKRDRKSTRLNSSHVSISYAVFCLKKKIVWLH